jgi:hypothetical protein
MVARIRFSWDYIAPNSTASVFMHGYTYRQAVSYSATVYGLPGDGVPFPASHIILTQGETFRHVDGTVARKVYVQNRAPFNPCQVDILEIIESF